MTVVYIDWETRSEVDLSRAGAHNYAIHRSTEALCLGWAIDAQPAKVTPFTETDRFLLFKHKFKSQLNHDLTALFRAIIDGATVVAHNVGFDRLIWEELAVKGRIEGYRFPEVSEEQWRCSSAAATHFGVPRGLADAGEFLGLEKQKLPSRPVKALSFPLKKWQKTRSGKKWDDRPEVFDELYIYCIRDVEVCRHLFTSCPPLSEMELKVWRADQRINRRGIPVDSDLVKACIKIHNANVVASNEAIERVTKGAVKAATARDKILKWVRARGVVAGNLRADTVRDLLDGSLDPDVRKVLELRVDGGGAASSKYQAFHKAASPDGRIRGTFVYCGCRTGRWAARLIQPHNLIRPPKAFSGKGKEHVIGILADAVREGNLDLARVFGSDRDVLAAMLRPSFRAPAGRKLMALDYGQVEARITAWLAGETELLRMFADGVDVYTDMAKRIDPKNPNRQLGKAAVLGLGFGMWVDAFVLTCKSWGIKAPREVIERAVYVFRESFPGIPQLWSNLAHAAQTAILNPGKAVHANKLRFRFSSASGILTMILPSGRAMYYHRAEISDDGIRYWARTGTENKGKVGEVRGWGARLTENGVQAIAACLLREGLVRTEEELPQVDPVFHAHDELVVECDEDADLFAPFLQTFLVSPGWAEGLPIAADGWEGRDYRK